MGIPYRTTNATCSKDSSDLSLKRMEFILPCKMSVFIFGETVIVKKKNVSYT